MKIKNRLADGNGTIPTDKAKAAIEAEREERRQQASIKIREILAQYRVVLVPLVVIAGTQLSSHIDVRCTD